MTATDKPHHRIAIIGSGPAGLTAAIYTARALFEPVVFEGLQPGGQLTTTTEVENYPGFPEAVMGPQLMQDMRAQAARFGTQFRQETVQQVDFGKPPFTLTADSGACTADAVIIAAGASANWLGLESEQKLRGHGVSACATCDGFFFRDKDVLVIGGGDSAIEEASFLTRFAAKVTIVHRRDALRASKFMQQKAFDNPKIEVAWDSVVEEVLDVASKQVTGARLRNVKTGAEQILPCQGFFLAIGHTPNTAVFKGQLDMDEKGYLSTKPGSTATSVAGVFAAGDVQDHRYRQAITAAGSGCMAALDAEAYLGR
ncbi:MAG: thioredoxin-disulfide reductase [Kiritimatiellae bacterium]|nr:thioredoxin-disulfide reductase [Kiritimatiellia bacterium]